MSRRRPTRRGTAHRPLYEPNGGTATEPLVTVAEAAELLGVQPGTVYLWAELGDIPSYKIGALRRFRLSELAAYLQARREGPPPQG